MNAWTEEKDHHRVAHAGWILNHGRPPHNLSPVHCSLGLVSPEGREDGYESGFDRVQVGHDFQKFGIGKILARNAMNLFRANGDTKIRANTESKGSYFWQDLGFLPTKEETDLNDEDNMFSDFDERNSYMSHDQLCHALENKLSSLHDAGSIDAKLHDKTLAKISTIDPTFIWKILGIDTPVRASFENEHPVRLAPLGKALMENMRISTFFDMLNPKQMKRFDAKTSDIEIDEHSFGRRTSKYIATQRHRFDEDRKYDELMSRV